MTLAKLKRDDFEAQLTSTLVEDHLEALNTSGYLERFLPEVHALVGFGGGGTGHKALWDHTKQVVAQTLRQPHLRWAALFHDVGKPLCFTKDPDTGEVSFHMHEGVSARLWKKAARRVGWFSPEEIDLIYFLIYHLGHVEAYESDWTDSAVRRLRGQAGDHLVDLLALARADITTKHDHKRAAHHRRLRELWGRIEDLTAIDATPPALPTGLGTRLTEEFGIPPSKALGDIMNLLKSLVEEGLLPRQAPVETLVAYVKDHPEHFPHAAK